MKKKHLPLICFNLKFKTIFVLLFVYCLTNTNLHAINKNTIDSKEEKANKTVNEDRSALSAAALAPTIILDEIPDTCKTDEFTNIFISPTYSYTADPTCQIAGNPTYAWSFPEINETSTSPTPTDIEYTTPGVYTVNLTVTDACGVSATASRTFEIFAKPIINTGSSSAGLQEVCQTETAPTL
ncbi:MAG: PKD domain-containing protein, partial [Polaribacter sp.]